MLEVLSKFICFIIMSVTSFIIIKRVSNSEVSLKEPRSIILVLLLTIILAIIYNTTYKISKTIVVLVINLLFYKIIFRFSKEEALICCGLYLIILFSSDIICGVFLRLFLTMNEIKTDPILAIISNLLISLISIIFVSNKSVKSKCNEFIKYCLKKNKLINNVFIILLICCFICSGYNVAHSRNNEIDYILNFLIILFLTCITSIFIQGRIKYNQLSDEYETLFDYVQNFEEWIEKEQINRHEYKNQLAVLRSITKDESVINKINEILDDNIKIKGDVVYKLKELPKGGLKGLMYYKVAIAQKQNINIEVDVSIKRKSIFKSLSESQMKVLCNLIGIYFDNAIEAALETKKKYVSIEVYEQKSGIKFVISNTFRQSENFDKRNEKGVTTKGKDHGNGLYYANNLLAKNHWLEASQNIADDFYIQNIIIKKLD